MRLYGDKGEQQQPQQTPRHELQHDGTRPLGQQAGARLEWLASAAACVAGKEQGHINPNIHPGCTFASTSFRPGLLHTARVL